MRKKCLSINRARLPPFIYIALHPLHLIAQLKCTANSTREDVRQARHRNANRFDGSASEADDIGARNHARLQFKSHFTRCGEKKRPIKPFKRTVTFVNNHSRGKKKMLDSALRCKTRAISDRQLSRPVICCALLLVEDKRSISRKTRKSPKTTGCTCLMIFPWRPRELNQFYSRARVYRFIAPSR